MDKNPIGELMQNTMESVKNMLKVDTVVGDPIITPDGITLVPISRISLGFGGGGVEFSNKKIGESSITEDMLCSAVFRAAPANHFALWSLGSSSISCWN